MERTGVSAVIIEDKKDLRKTLSWEIKFIKSKRL